MSSPKVSADADANFHAVWAQGAEIRARRFSADEQSWEDIQVFRAHTAEGGLRPSLEANSDGEAWLVWYEHPFVWTSHFAADSGWGSGTPLSSELEPNAPVSHQAQLASSEDGTRVAVWADGTDVWSWAVRP